MNPRTNPLRPGAPLPEGASIDPPENPLIRAELMRAKTELMHAIARHRKAWTAMANYKEDIELNTSRVFADSDPMWKKKTSDVAWWCSEMAAQAAVVTALTAMLPQPMPGYAETTSFSDAANGQRTFQRTGTEMTCGDIVRAWDQKSAPTIREREAAAIWIKITAEQGIEIRDRGLCKRILEWTA